LSPATSRRSPRTRNLRRDPRVALSLTPADNPFQPVIVRGRVVDRIEDDAAWEIVDRISTKYIGGPHHAATSGSSRSSNLTGKARAEAP